MLYLYAFIFVIHCLLFPIKNTKKVKIVDLLILLLKAQSLLKYVSSFCIENTRNFSKCNLLCYKAHVQQSTCVVGTEDNVVKVYLCCAFELEFGSNDCIFITVFFHASRLFNNIFLMMTFSKVWWSFQIAAAMVYVKTLSTLGLFNENS